MKPLIMQFFLPSFALLHPNILPSSLLKPAMNMFFPLLLYGCDIASCEEGHGSTLQN